MKHIIANGFKGERAIVTPYSVREYQAGNSITRQLYVTHMGYYPYAQHHYQVREDGANEHILIYCEEGKGWIKYHGNCVQLKENSFFIIPAKEKHAYGADSNTPWSIYWLHFQGEQVEMFESIMGKLIHLEPADQNRRQDRIQLFNEMYQNLEMGYNPENLEYISCCLRYFLASIKYVSQYGEIKKAKGKDIVQKSILFMTDNLENNISLEDIAGAAGCSSSYLNALFTRRIAIPPKEYFNQLRIQRACSYLQFSALQIKEIAFLLKYYDPFHFSHAFHKEMGINPKEYRKKFQFDKTMKKIGE